MKGVCEFVYISIILERRERIYNQDYPSFPSPSEGPKVQTRSPGYPMVHDTCYHSEIPFHTLWNSQDRRHLDADAPLLSPPQRIGMDHPDHGHAYHPPWLKHEQQTDPDHQHDQSF